uniref:ankyrin repeat domain-containing protein n=1 Tax=Gelidibacter sp. TaxID=2018083 RepID=UPI004049AD37
MKKLSILIIGFLFGIQGFSQENVFLKREFWKTNPNIETIETKIAEGNNLAELNTTGFDGVVYAILEGTSNETIQYLINKNGNDVNKRTHDGRTYIFWAAYAGNDELMQYLVSKGAKTNLTDDKGSTILNYAALSGQKNTKVYDFCLANGANLKNDVTPYGANALLLAAPFDTDFSLINYFLSKGLNLTDVDSDGNGIFNYVAKTGNITLLNQLLEKGVKFNDNAMIFASQGTRSATNSLEVFKYLEGLGIKPNAISKDGTTALHALASRVNDQKLLGYFIEKGVDINQADNNGTTAFMNAVNRNKLEVITFLSSYVKDINAKNNKGETALSLAIANNSQEIVEFLIEKNADVNVLDANGNHLGYYLLQHYNSKNKDAFEAKLALLQSKGLDITLPQKDGNTLYHLALDKNDLELLKRVHQFKIDINAKNNEGLTALHKAAMKASDTEVLKYLISIGADKSITTDFEETVYDLASENELLSQKNINIDFLK